MPRKLDIALSKALVSSRQDETALPLTGEKPDDSELLKHDQDSSTLSIHGRISVRTIHGKASIQSIHGAFSLKLDSGQMVNRVTLRRNEDGDIIVELHE